MILDVPSFVAGVCVALALVAILFTAFCVVTGRPTAPPLAPAAKYVEPGTAFDENGTLTPDARYRLVQIRCLGMHYHEQLSGLAAEACEIFGVDSSDESLARDWADEIAYHQADIDIAAVRIWRFLHTEPDRRMAL